MSADFRVRYLDGREVGSFGILQADVNFARYEPTVAFFYRNNPGAAGTGSKAERRFADAAERSYAIELARLDAGTGSGFEVIQSQNMKARAKLTFIEQILRFNAAQIELAAVIGHLTPELFAP